ncbi:MAG: prolyl oligopeptidase family serine peptidase [Acidimicrobiia bacterium]
MPDPSEYPPARRSDDVDELHGTRIADPYRWLEDAGDPETEAWSSAQDALVRGVLDELPGRARLHRRLEELLPGSVSGPAVVGQRYFFTRRLPDQEHPVLLVREGDEERALVDVAALDPTFTTTLDDYSPSPDGSRLAYQISEGGRENKTLRIIDVATGDLVEEPISVGRACPVGWLPGGDAFYYVRPADGVSEFDRRVWLHRIGDDPAGDVLVFGEGRDKSTYYDLSISADGRWLVVGGWIGTEPRNDLYIADVSDGEHDFIPVQEGLDADTNGRVHRDGKLYLLTSHEAPKRRIVVVDPRAPAPENWHDVVPESDAVIEDWALTDAHVVTVHLRDVKSEVEAWRLDDGSSVGRLDLPGLGLALVRARRDRGEEVWIDYTDFVTPSLVLHATLPGTGTTTWATAPGALDVKGITARQVFYASKDGTRVPMFVIARDDIEPNGARPTILYGYGGFNISLTPAYSAGILAWTEAGGVYAIANLRGGSEYGEDWHRAGMRDKKQNVFDDFHAAAEWLIANKWTDSDHLACSGGSNGGLLVGAAVTQRPDLFTAAVCSAPLLDMVRYEKFGLGVTWNDEYGTADDAEELGWLLSYSPYHRVQEGTRYPATLFTVFEGDTRVDPLHARKLCAAMQHATSARPDDSPVLIRRETDVGHSTRAKSRTIALTVDTMSFLASRTGLQLG